MLKLKKAFAFWLGYIKYCSEQFEKRNTYKGTFNKYNDSLYY